LTGASWQATVIGMPIRLHGVAGQRLRKLRRDRELTATYVARQAQISRQYLHALEAGDHVASDEIRIRLAEVLGVEVSDVWQYPHTGDGSVA
jgi:DNA-binding XRE family transcriptional regulator